MIELNRLTFAEGSGLLDRATHLRDMSGDLLRHRRAALLPLWQEKILIDVEANRPQLGWVPPETTDLRLATEAPVFLGLSSQTPCFTADFSALTDDAAEALFCDGARFMALRDCAGELGPASASIAATAKGVLGWHMANPFCARCGGSSSPGQGGWSRQCERCDAVHFPRTDPIVIMLIVHGDNVLLGRRAAWPAGRYSLLAGFVEPGETLADAARRATFEETGVRTGAVGFLASQPWPFPSSLMLGCVGEAETAEITVDADALEDAQWISRAKMAVVLEGRHPRIDPPRTDAIAHAILTDWVNDRIPGP